MGSTLADRFFHHAPPEASPQDQGVRQAMAASMAELSAGREPGRAAVRVHNPSVEEHGWTSRHTIVQVVTDDMPFLVDSVLGALSQRKLTVHELIHPQLVLDAQGEVLDVDLATTRPGPDQRAESWIMVAVDRLGSAEARDSLAERLEIVLSDVRKACDDWKGMRQRVRSIIAELQLTPPSTVDPATVQPTIDFLSWLDDNHFTYLGFRSYDLVEQDDQAFLRAVPGSGLGILRDDGAPPSLSQLRPEAAATAREARLLTVTKANTRATVHRTVPLDYVGVRRFDQAGRVVGEVRFLGLFTQSAYAESATRLPVAGPKVRHVVETSDYASDSHSGKDLVSILEGYPRDELLQAPVEHLSAVAHDVLRLLERPEAKAYVRKDEFGRFMSAVVYLPRDRYNTASRLRVQRILEEAYGGTMSDYATRISDGPLAQLHYLISLPKDGSAAPDAVDEAALQERIRSATRSWSEDLNHAAYEQQEDEATVSELLSRFAPAFPEAYKEDFDGATGYVDLRRVAEVADGGSPRPHLYHLEGDPQEVRRLKVYRREPMVLSEVLPVFSNLGLEVSVQRPYEIDVAEGETYYIYDYALRAPRPDHWVGDGGEISDEDVATAFEDAFIAIGGGEVESDKLNSLVLGADLDVHEIVILRAIVRYLSQVGTHSRRYIESALVANPEVAVALVELFVARFDPDLDVDPEARQDREEQIVGRIGELLDQVASLDQDRILRSGVDLVRASLRTNYFQRDEEGRRKPSLSVKLLPRELPMLPEPRPAFEIWVYSPRVEGSHLRFGAVARGGLRWSDRREDFRTEVLGLVKAQMVKNAVIVPTGSKGAFYAKQLPPASDREAWLAEGQAAYTTFISGMLDITDNRTADGIEPPDRVVRHDDDDPYLVVAADKGTAKFSDLANGIARDYGFWLDDAFASGGSAGYDHKEMGITARGAWESVKRHFRELGHDTQSEDFTVVGVGDMSGDVFGNGMLLSEHIRLVGAFDHRHIFLDPDPDAAASYAERQRMFELPGSSWEDYDSSLISEGGGVYPRTAKSIPISAQVRDRLGLDQGVSALAPTDLLKAILMAPVDLLWNGGIGTYVKASTESHADIGDRSNDAIRVDGNQLRVRVVGEGGNLGLSQRGRVEAALNGVHVNTDAIDNSGGVDSSDHEVNIKIALTPLVTDGTMSLEERNGLLASMTDEVAEKVLRHNYEQNVLIGNARYKRDQMAPVHRGLMQHLVETADLDPALEFLPDDAEWERRAKEGAGLTSPEFAVLMAYAKLGLKDALTETDLGQDPAMDEMLLSYFPSAMRERTRDQLLAHPLRNQIIVNQIANEMVNRGGVSFAYRAVEETAATYQQIARAFVVVRDVFGLHDYVDAVEELDNVVDTDVQTELYLEFRRLIDRGVRWFLNNRSLSGGIQAELDRFLPPVRDLMPQMGQLLQGKERERWHGRVDWATGQGVPQELAQAYASLLDAFSLLDVVEVGMEMDRDVAEVAEVYFGVSEAFGLDELLTRVSELPRDDQWSSLARGALRDDIYGVMRGLTQTVTDRTEPGSDSVERVRDWMIEHREALTRTSQMLDRVRELDSPGLGPLSVALRTMRGLVRQGAAS